MLTCEECGCLVDPECTEIHEGWHAKLVTVNPEPPAPVNPTNWGDITIMPCACGKPGC